MVLNLTLPWVLFFLLPIDIIRPDGHGQSYLLQAGGWATVRKLYMCERIGVSLRTVYSLLFTISYRARSLRVAGHGSQPGRQDQQGPESDTEGRSGVRHVILLRPCGLNVLVLMYAAVMYSYHKTVLRKYLVGSYIGNVMRTRVCSETSYCCFIR